MSNKEKELMEKIIDLQAKEIAELKELVAAQKDQIITLNKIDDNNKEIIRIQKEIIEEFKLQNSLDKITIPPNSILN